MKNNIFKILILMFLFSCNNEDGADTSKSKLFSSNEIEVQSFRINNENDTIIVGQKGTQFKISKNTFEAINGDKIKGNISLEIKEVFDKSDIVIGNLLTTSNGKFLETEGMIFINAKTEDGKNCKIGETKEIIIEVQSEEFIEGMNLFEGQIGKDSVINWIRPEEISKQVRKVEEPKEEMQLRQKEYETNFSLLDSKSSNGETEYKLPFEISEKFWEDIRNNGGLIISNDTSFEFEGHTIYLTKLDSSTNSVINNFDAIQPNFNAPNVKGTNTFREDEQTNYIFSINKLGWANIDRFFTDPRNEVIELVVNVDEYEKYEQIYISMIFKNQNMYLPGYQKKDNSFSFTHGDYEETMLPISENAIILVTARKGEESYYSMNNFIIEKEQNFNLKLNKTTKEELKEKIKNEI